MSDHLRNNDTKSQMCPNPLSDHSYITLHLSFAPFRKGPGLWRIDNELLSNKDYRDLILKTIKEVETQSEGDGLSDPCMQWEWMKFQIKLSTIKFAQDLKTQSNSHRKLLQDSLVEAHREADAGESVDPEELRGIERELREMELSSANRAIQRSKVNWAINGEKPTKYFLN